MCAHAVRLLTSSLLLGVGVAIASFSCTDRRVEDVSLRQHQMTVDPWAAQWLRLTRAVVNYLTIPRSFRNSTGSLFFPRSHMSE